MWDFDDSEWFFFVATAVIAAVGGFFYYRFLTRVSLLGKSIHRRALLALLPIAAVIPTYIVLCRWADARAIGHIDYTALFMIGAAAWVFAASRTMELLGISVHDDAIERDNPAALVAVVAFLMGVGIVYAFSNIGMGPTIWTTIFPALAATILLMLMWLLIESISRGVVESVTIDRDIATAFRLAGAMIGCAIILGLAAAGKWVSGDQTWRDLLSSGWPAVILAMAAAMLQWAQWPTAAHPRPNVFTRGVVPALSFVAAGIVVVEFGKNGLHPAQW